MKKPESQIRKTRYAITEREFSQQVEGLLTMFGWHWCHFRPARTEDGWRTALSGYQGFPDYLMVKGHRVIYAELKSAKGQPTPEQYEWLLALTEARQEVYLWRPDDFNEVSGILETETKGGN